ncbi:peptide chain release factor-like protein [Deltaproteobacteria bacterium Smac51]|nr:peptide chain release factor-like protein [Deltaproteobacteria bacterium Smac51]
MRVQISSGRGPAECELAVGLYLEFFRKKHPEAVLIEVHGGWSRKLGERKVIAYKSVVLELPEGHEVCLGSVKWSCPSPLRSNHGRKNWFIEINILPEIGEKKLDHSGLDPDSPDRRLIRIETFRSPGRGGQNVNKVETGVRAVHLPTGLSCSSTSARTQGRNKKLAIERLAELILTHNLGLEKQNMSDERKLHDQLERGNPLIVFKGLEFKMDDSVEMP